MKITWVSKFEKVQIGHPRDRAPITWQIGVRRTNHDREFCYRYDYLINRIYNKILDRDWFSARLFDHVGVPNRPRTSRSSDFEITRPITPWIVQLLLLILEWFSIDRRKYSDYYYFGFITVWDWLGSHNWEVIQWFGFGFTMVWDWLGSHNWEVIGLVLVLLWFEISWLGSLIGK